MTFQEIATTPRHQLFCLQGRLSLKIALLLLTIVSNIINIIDPCSGANSHSSWADLFWWTLSQSSICCGENMFMLHFSHFSDWMQTENYSCQKRLSVRCQKSACTSISAVCRRQTCSTALSIQYGTCGLWEIKDTIRDQAWRAKKNKQLRTPFKRRQNFIYLVLLLRASISRVYTILVVPRKKVEKVHYIATDWTTTGNSTGNAYSGGFWVKLLLQNKLHVMRVICWN